MAGVNEEIRRNVRQQIDNALKQAGILKSRPNDLEQQIFDKSKTKEDYVKTVGTIIKKAQLTRQTRLRQQAMPHGMNQQIAHSGMNQQNPGMTQQNPGMTQQNPGMMQQNPGMTQQNTSMNQQNLAMAQQNPGMNQQNPSMAQQNPGMNQQNMNMPNMGQQNLIQPNMMQNNMSGMSQQNVAQNMNQQMNQPMNQHINNPGMNQPNMMNQPTNQGSMQIRNNMQMNRNNVLDHPSNTMQPSPISNATGIPNFSPDRGAMQHPSPGNSMYSGRQVQRPQGMVPGQTQLKTPDNSYANTPQAPHIPSLSPAHLTGQSPRGVMSPALRTPGSVNTTHSPGNPMSNGPAPSPSQSQGNMGYDEKIYMEKLKQLQKYIEPLSRMIDKEKHSNEVSKMKSLRNTLMDPRKRLPMPTLLKCEKVLKNWIKVEKMPPITIKPQPDQHMCQPLLDVVAERRPQNMLNHTLKRTFGNALYMFNNGYSVPENVCCRRIKLADHYDVGDKLPSKDGNVGVPDAIQGEIARLNDKFIVTVDQSQSTVNGDLHLICRLNSDNLPSVPPIHIVVPVDYPQTGVDWQRKVEMWKTFSEDKPEGPNPGMDDLMSHIDFLKRLEPIMDTQIGLALESSQSISSLLTAWEISIKQSIAVPVS